MLVAQVHLVRSKVWDCDITNRAIRDGTPRDPPLPDDVKGFRDFVICPQGLTRKVAEALVIHASWINVNPRGAGLWSISHKIAAVKGLFHGYFNPRNLGRVVAMLDLLAGGPTPTWHPRVGHCEAARERVVGHRRAEASQSQDLCGLAH